MLLANSNGINWGTFPKPGASDADQLAAQLEVCRVVTSTMDTIANQTLRAVVSTEQEFGPDFTITIQHNGWARFRLSRWPIAQIIGARVSPANVTPPDWTVIPTTALVTEHSALPAYGTIVPSGAGPGPVAVLIAPGYVDWWNGRNGYYVQMDYINGFPVSGIDQNANAGATSVHVDDITGWWNGTEGARGGIQDPPLNESITVIGVTPDTVGAISGPGLLLLDSPLIFPHQPTTSATSVTVPVLVSGMPAALQQAGFYLATHFGLIRGTTAVTIQSRSGGQVQNTVRGATDWWGKASELIKYYARVF